MVGGHCAVAIDSLAGHGQAVQYTSAPVLFAVKRCTQTGSRCNPTMESHPPGTQRKQSVTQADKVHFLCQTCTLPAFICCGRRFWKAFYGPNGPILTTFCRIMAPKSPENCWTTPPKKTNQKCVKITPKWVLGAFWTVWRPFLSLIYGFPKE